MAAYTAVSPIYTSGAYPVRYLPYSIFDSGKHPAPVPAVIKDADSVLLRAFSMHANGKPARVLDDREDTAAPPQSAGSISALSEVLMEPAVHTEVRELDAAAVVRGETRAADKHELPHGTVAIGEQAELFRDKLAHTENRNGTEVIVQGETERTSTREADVHAHQSASRDVFTAAHSCMPQGAVTDLRGITQIHTPVSTQYYYAREAEISQLTGYRYLGSRTAFRQCVAGAMEGGAGGAFAVQHSSADRGAVRGTAKLTPGYGERDRTRGGKFSVLTGSKSVSNALIQKYAQGLERAVSRSGVRLTDSAPAARKLTEVSAQDGMHLSIPFSRLHKVVDVFQSTTALSRLFRGAGSSLDIVSAGAATHSGTELGKAVGAQGMLLNGTILDGFQTNTAANYGAKLDGMVDARTIALPGSMLDSAPVETVTHSGAELDGAVDAQTRALAGEVLDGTAVLKQDKEVGTAGAAQPVELAPDDAAVSEGMGLEREVSSAELLCVPRGLSWDALWEELFRDYSERVDRLQLPPVDFKYDTALLYDPKTGEPYKPLSPADVPEVMVEFPASHPVGKYADVGLKIVNVHLWVLRDVMLLLYRDLKENTFSYEKLPPGEAVRVAIDRLYNKLRQFDYKREEYQRAFRMVRWYSEYVIVSTNNYFLVREYEPWISHEQSLNLEDGIPKDDRSYIVRADGWAVDRDKLVYATQAKDAVLEINIANLLPTTFEFTVAITNASGTAAAKLTVDGQDKSYLLASLARAEADLPKGNHTILFEFHTESEEDRMELSGMKVDYVKFRSAQVIESPKNVNGYEAVDMLIGMLKRYYDLHHEGKVKGTRLFNLGKRPRLGR